MSDINLDELGPVDYLVVEFPAGQQNFTGEIAEELVRLSESGTIRVLDVLLLMKDEAGDVDVLELSDGGGVDEIVQMELQLADLLAAEDLANLAIEMGPGSVAGVLVYENVWAAPLGSAARRAGGQLAGGGRVPIQALIAAAAGDDQDSSEG
ncbi:DUF6325 family protein [Microbacterium sp. DT81.1]|uniref:DUF6325 family protein n=1 Tax=Microbacterium sp. DT81.1 TaxID=3393413 RepID=UPI003CF4C801